MGDIQHHSVSTDTQPSQSWLGFKKGINRETEVGYTCIKSFILPAYPLEKVSSVLCNLLAVVRVHGFGLYVNVFGGPIFLLPP